MPTLRSPLAAPTMALVAALAGPVACGGGNGGSPCAGDVLVASPADVAAAQACHAIGGSLRLRGPDLVTVRLPALQTIGNELSVLGSTGDNLRLDTVDLPALTAVHGPITLLANPALTAVRLPSLTAAGSSVRIEQNGLLTVLDAPVLSTVGGPLMVRFNGLAECDVAALVTRLAGNVGSVVVGSNASTPACPVFRGDAVVHTAADLAGLEAAAYWQIDGTLTIYAEDVASVSLPSVTRVGGSLTIMTSAFTGLFGQDGHEIGPSTLVTVSLPALERASNLVVYANPLLTRLDLPALTTLTASPLQIASNDSLTDVTLPGRIDVGNPAPVPTWITITGNRCLPAAAAQSILDRVAFHGNGPPTIDVSGNGTSACP